MHARITALSTGLLIALSTVPTRARAQAPLPSPVERAFIASRLDAAMQIYFAHWDDAPGVDLDSAFRRSLDAALGAPDRLAFTLASQEFLASFRNGHTVFMDRALVREPIGLALGFDMRFLEGRWVVTRSEVPALRPGDVVSALDGTPMEDFFQTRRRFIAASTERWTRRMPFMRVPGFFSGGMYFPLAFALTLTDGRTVQVDRRALASDPPAEEMTEGRWLRDGEVAYIRIPSFAQPSFADAAVEFVKRFSNAETLIVDVRENSGGTTPHTLTTALMERPYRWWAESTPLTLALHRAHAEAGNGWYDDFRRSYMSWPSRTWTPENPLFRGRLILLVDGGCNSACEDFVMPFKDTGRATLIGEATAGSTGQPYMADFGNEMIAIIGTKREFFPDGSRFEGVGIRPDVEVAPRIRDVRAGRDPVLERAVAHARGR